MDKARQTPGETVRGVSFRVEGRVQGVAYRWFGRRSANKIGVSGWIRNCADGAVEGEAFGEPARIEAFLERLRTGPPRARVERLVSSPVPQRPSGGEFEIRY